MRRFILALVVAVSFVSISGAQDYKTALGLRGGFSSGLTLKHFIDRKVAVEGILSTRWRGFDITGLYEVHGQAFDVDRLNWYYGFGAHIGFWDGRYAPWGNIGTSYTVIGIDGILGLEYNFTEIPVNIGIDWKPAFNVFGNQGFWGDGGALSLRYMF